MGTLIGLILLAIGIVLVLKIAGGVLGFLVAVVVAACIGFGAEFLVPGDRMPRGWLAAIGAGLVGSWLGNLVLGNFGPTIAGFAVLPAILGAMVVVLAVTAFARSAARS